MIPSTAHEPGGAQEPERGRYFNCAWPCLCLLTPEIHHLCYHPPLHPPSCALCYKGSDENSLDYLTSGLADHHLKPIE
jgi:hypothetical protein